MIGRRSVWSDPVVQELLAQFVPVADEVWLLQHAETPEGELFRVVAEQGHYAGRERPTGTRQGTYALAPSGRMLASINHNDPRRMEQMLRDALAAWEAMPREERLPAEALADSVTRPEDLYPEDGMALRVIARDLPRDDRPTDWRGGAWNMDYAWFTRDEARSFLPESVEVGATSRLTDELANRLARLHVIDDVRGQTTAYPEDAVETARIESSVTAVEGGRATIRIEGDIRNVQRGRWPVAGFQDMDSPSDQERGMDVRLLGYATFDLETERFVALEMVASGTRWGATQYNGRSDDPGPAPIGIAFVLAGDTPAERVAPAFYWAYGRRR